MTPAEELVAAALDEVLEVVGATVLEGATVVVGATELVSTAADEGAT